MPRDDLARLRHLAEAGDAAAAVALEREALRRGDVALARLAKARQGAGEVAWAVLADRLNALSDPDPEVRALAVDEVATLGLPMRAVGKPLLDALRDPAEAVRAAAAAALSSLDAVDAGSSADAGAASDAQVNAALEAALQDPSPWVRDQAAASLLMRPEQERERWPIRRWQRLRTQLYAEVCQSAGASVEEPQHDLYMDIFLMEPPLRQRSPLPPVVLDGEDDPLHWAFMVADALCGSGSYQWLGEAQRAVIARLAPLTALAVTTELCCDHWLADGLWPDADEHGPLLTRCVGIGAPSAAMIAQLDAQLRSDVAGARHAAAIGCSALLTGMHSHALRALAARWAAHEDPLVRACLLPGLLLIAADPERKHTAFEEALCDPAQRVRRHALTLLTGHWEGPWARSLNRERYHRYQPFTQEALALRDQWPPQALHPIWTRSAVDTAAAFSFYTRAAHDPEAEVRAQALVGLARVHETYPALAPACASPLRISALQDPNFKVRDLALMLLRYLTELPLAL
jgi:hypothetical protein